MNSSSKKSITTVVSPRFLLAPLFSVPCLAICTGLVLYRFFQNPQEYVAENLIFVVLCLSFLWAMLLGVIIFVACNGAFTTVTIDEKGITNSVFGRYRKKSIGWDELSEMAFARFLLGVVFCGKEPLKGASQKQLVKNKALIRIPANGRALAVLRQYTDKEIDNLAEDMIRRLTDRFK